MICGYKHCIFPEWPGRRICKECRESIDNETKSVRKSRSIPDGFASDHRGKDKEKVETQVIKLLTSLFIFIFPLVLYGATSFTVGGTLETNETPGATGGTFGPTDITLTANDAYEADAGTNLNCWDTNGLVVGDTIDCAIGLRWPSTGIPQGATIESATLACYIDNANTSIMRVRLRAEDVDNCADFNSSPSVKNRTRTLSEAWDIVGIPDGTYSNSTSGFVSVIQTVVNRAGFGGNICIYIDDSDPQDSDAIQIIGVQCLDTGEHTCRLTVTWTE